MVKSCWRLSTCFVKNQNQKKSERSRDEKGSDWSDLPQDLLVSIFVKIKHLLSIVSLVCRSWYLATLDPVLWTTLDMRLYADTKFMHVDDLRLWNMNITMFKDLLDRSAGNATRITFSINCVPIDDDFVYISSQSRKLKQLTLPSWSILTPEGVRRAFRNWRNLEELALCIQPKPTHLEYPKGAFLYLETLVLELGMNCKKLRKLKLLSRVCKIQASAIATCLPELEILDLRLSSISMEALSILLGSCAKLRHLNISHCYLIDEGYERIRMNENWREEFNQTVTQQASSALEKFDYCLGIETGKVSACKLCVAAMFDRGKFCRTFERRKLYWLYEGHGCEPIRDEVPFESCIPYYVYTQITGFPWKFEDELKKFPDLRKLSCRKDIQLLRRM